MDTTMALCLAAVNDFSVFRLWCCIPGLFLLSMISGVQTVVLYTWFISAVNDFSVFRLCVVYLVYL